MYTFVDSLNKLSSLLGDSNDGSSDMFPSTIRKKELNIAEWQLAYDAKDLHGYESGTITSSKTITVPTDWIETHMLIIDNVPISNDREIAFSDWERYYNWAGTPPYYYFWTDAAGTLNINLIGNVEGLLYKLYYFKKPTSELSATTDISLHPEQFRMTTAYHAASELMRQIGNNARADEYRAVYEAGAMRAADWARRLYVTKEYARPDFGDSDTSTQDRQGQGYIY